VGGGGGGRRSVFSDGFYDGVWEGLDICVSPD